VAGNPARIVRPINGVYLHSTADGPLAQPEGNVVKQG